MHHENESPVPVEHLVSHAAHLLPAQGPINVFVHHNTLHAFEEQTFFNAVRRGADFFGCHPFLSEPEYRQELAAGNFGVEDIEAVLIEDLEGRDDHWIANLGTRFALRYSMLEHPVHAAPKAELEWMIAETDALRSFRRETPPAARFSLLEGTKRWLRAAVAGDFRGVPEQRVASIRREFGIRSFGDLEKWRGERWEEVTLQLLWWACQEGTALLPDRAAMPSIGNRHRDWLHEATGIDSDFYVHDLLIRFCAAFLDQGFSQWALPDRSQGFFHAFLRLYASARLPVNEALEGLGEELDRIQNVGMSASQSVAESLLLLGVSEVERQRYVSDSLLALRGWAGMIHQVEVRSDRVPQGIPSGSLVEYLAVRLILERVALKNLSHDAVGWQVGLPQLRRELRNRVPAVSEGTFSRAFSVFQIAQIRAWTPESLFALTKAEWAVLIEEIEEFGSMERRRLLQLAFERGYRNQVLRALQSHSRQFWMPEIASEKKSVARPSFQILCCIDDREESFRRHLEEIDPKCETFGNAGFFAIPMYYRGAADAHFVPLCPILLKPSHYVVETVADEFLELHGRRTRVRKVIGRQAHAWHKTSRTFLGGLAMALVGPLATLPLVGRVLFPRATAMLRKTAGSLVAPPSATRLTLERTGPTPGKEESGLGFSLEEMADSVERLLRDTGLTQNHSRLIVVCGHGSSSLNNPHESAYNCGACGGGRGGPNARAIAEMANDPRVRDRLTQRGLQLPEDTHFLGAYHNTCDDSVHFFDLTHLRESHRRDFEQMERTIQEACRRNAHERCRRFASASLSLGEDAALRHVQQRSEDLSQTRPEYNHATNAICIVGRRSRTRGLFLDRRSFLVSYDPAQDTEDDAVLTRILSAVIPVCGGINLEYYFSRVDVAGYGCGSKLPHNVTSLLGVMDGAASDLRTGLSAQMVEIHDPVRLLFVIETRPEAFLAIMKKVPAIHRLCAHGWVQVATLSPDSATMHLLKGERFQRVPEWDVALPQVARSRDWYRGSRGNLELAQVVAGFPPHRWGR